MPVFSIWFLHFWRSRRNSVPACAAIGSGMTEVWTSVASRFTNRSKAANNARRGKAKSARCLISRRARRSLKVPSARKQFRSMHFRSVKAQGESEHRREHRPQIQEENNPEKVRDHDDSPVTAPARISLRRVRDAPFPGSSNLTVFMAAKWPSYSDSFCLLESTVARRSSAGHDRQCKRGSGGNQQGSSRIMWQKIAGHTVFATVRRSTSAASLTRPRRNRYSAVSFRFPRNPAA